MPDLNPILAVDDPDSGTLTVSRGNSLLIDVLANDLVTTGFAFTLNVSASGLSLDEIEFQNEPDDFGTYYWFQTLSGTGTISGTNITISLADFTYVNGSAAYSGCYGTAQWANGTVKLETPEGTIETYDTGDSVTIDGKLIVDANEWSGQIQPAWLNLAGTGVQLTTTSFDGLHSGDSATISTSGQGHSDDFGPPTITRIVTQPDSADGNAVIEGNQIRLNTTTSGTSMPITFEYEITDETGATDIALVTVAVSSPGTGIVANDDPGPETSAITTPIDTPTNINVLANDAFTSLTSISMTSQQNGTVIIVDNGTPSDFTDDTIDFIPASGFVGAAQFTYTIHDGPDSDSATVAIAVTSSENNQPVAEDASFQTISSAVTGTELGTVNVTDDDSWQFHTWSMVTPEPGFSISEASGVVWISDSSLVTAPPGVTLTKTITVRATDNGTPAKFDDATITIDIYGLHVSLQLVNYLDNHTIYRDPVWSGAPSTETIPFPISPDVAYPHHPAEYVPDQYASPVAYTSGDKARVWADFKVMKPASGVLPLIRYRAVGPDGIEFPAVTPSFLANESDHWIDRYGSESANNAFTPNTVTYYADFRLTWEVQYAGRWYAIGTSSNELYVTLNDPTTVGKLYHSIIHTSTLAATGATSVQQVQSEVWDTYTNQTITDKNGITLVYSHPSNASFTFAGDPPSNARGLLAFHQGQCGSFTGFFLEQLNAQGAADGASIHQITENYGNADGFVVREINYGVPVNWGHGFGYDYRVSFGNLNNADDNASPHAQATLAAQNKLLPEQFFKNHIVLSIGTIIYDASYGMSFNDLTTWQVAALTALMKAEIVEGQGVRFYLKRLATTSPLVVTQTAVSNTGDYIQ